LYISYEKSGAVNLAELGLIEGWLVGRQADEIYLNFEMFKVCCKSKYSIFYFVLPRY